MKCYQCKMLPIRKCSIRNITGPLIKTTYKSCRSKCLWPGSGSIFSNADFGSGSLYNLSYWVKTDVQIIAKKVKKKTRFAKINLFPENFAFLHFVREKWKLSLFCKISLQSVLQKMRNFLEIGNAKISQKNILRKFSTKSRHNAKNKKFREKIWSS